MRLMKASPVVITSHFNVPSTHIARILMHYLVVCETHLPEYVCVYTPRIRGVKTQTGTRLESRADTATGVDAGPQLGLPAPASISCLDNHVHGTLSM
ncbi:hypothetical protein Syun_003825 [Stephania yunnanensis]|uniref:Uncharacterized protein n=1 Tax=Stephania yunnanensis TaxID=152371 RepID=A0AAP0Q0K8_9MAGN